ncbi:acetyl-coenzyme A synthetase [Candidatus Roizmanbacteria bacterium CG22_combo_CG10-13_8_21_14_all_35_9]|uniref:acetate--CoA ligase n=4 Tax=Candidatus Roizmaniibacteriota TaxID=1752723 RepID=A0A2M8F1C5_9BACT|nr:MAG: acetyl-coenzyme A synthetase [Candidatus Roizmanbacteria bacterium CG23_combo_of_CG06-09_8_20_14_all_35_49]PIP62387.1 MAG: acetyl-coenzyme A synthetase [Candidatus Roizmanbacteria bacterium CG22_combo_CG10-13_8_21_14_all_35_9]PIY70670.1 MAG: acetyl-coenzyme A synthetase [Candidatus Roizmanbacteria bacterium CG_4_10_14_0_8_um_filter_35_28]PJC33102.1 MAG: acetyl-coenzyme A synthetase [Candidatus Roizmanbacteria bacterium CG_4_9_14_0_2_um_filter_35_15]PJC82539.1 MAG: acetyl-coenzyme A synt
MLIKPDQKLIDSLYVKNYEKLYKESIENPESFWEKIAKELFWFKPWNKVLDWKWPYARWFTGGQTNIVANCLDRHLGTLKNDTTLVRPSQSGNGQADKIALIWVGQDMSERKFTYRQLNEEVCKFANGLKSLGLKKGDHVTIYLPRVPEQDIAMLACAKIGLVHSVVFSGFSIDALKNRIEDAQSKAVITTDWYPYKEKTLTPIKNVEEVLKENKTVKHVIVVKRIEGAKMPVSNDLGGAQRSEHAHEVRNTVSSDQNSQCYHWWHDLVAKQDTICPTEVMEATDPLYILYTSGSTGKPKGILHSHGGYMVGTYITLKWIFNLMLDDIYWCTADAGWVTGHSYIVYSPLINGITTFVYESVPDYPHPGRWWELIEKYKVTKFYTAPTAIRALMRLGDEIPKKYNLSSLKILGSVGEPINPEAWLWFYKNIGRERCPIMDTWWQTETGMHTLSPLPSVPLKPGSCFKPFFGVKAEVVDENNNKVEVNKQGYLVIKTPWPAMLLDVYNNPQKYRETYFEKIKNEEAKIPVSNDLGGAQPNESEASTPTEVRNTVSSLDDFIYFTGDSAKIDEDGYFWIIGRNDDVIKVAGHRLGSAELESAFVDHPAVAEAAVIAKPDEIKGEKIKAFIILKVGQTPSEELKQELKAHVRKLIGPIATPDEIDFVDKLPKTRSGKIMRRVLKAQELGLPVGDTSTLES